MHILHKLAVYYVNTNDIVKKCVCQLASESSEMERKDN